MKILSAGLAAILLTFSLSVQAETSSNQKVSGFYIGGGIGNPSGKLDEVDRELKDKSYHVIAGYQNRRIYAWEMQYVKYGKDAHDYFDPSSFSVSTNVGYTFNSGIRPFVVLGFGVTNLNLPNKAGVIIISDSGLSYHYGIGVEFAPKELMGVTLRLAHESDFVNIEQKGTFSTRLYDLDLNSTYAAAIYKF